MILMIILPSCLLAQIRELPAGRGFADIVFLPRPSVSKPAIIVELKYGRSDSTAIEQIK
ncbi:MAG: hypothetical protein HFI10_14265 [Lachnospiraceae bacterium]|nr:hypothetical protein [Lachnospiraceae bacterium]